MDSGWAVVIGAGIALVSSVFAPWLKESHERRSRNLETNRASIAKCLLKITAITPVTAMTRVELDGLDARKMPFQATQAQARLLVTKSHDAQMAVFELDLLLTKQDAAIGTMARSVVNSSTNDDFAVELTCFNEASARWFRGEISAISALNRFASDVERYRAELMGAGVQDSVPNEVGPVSQRRSSKR